VATRLTNVVCDANDMAALSGFWSTALGWSVTYEDADEVCIQPPDGESGIEVIFVPVPEPKTGKNRAHLDLASASLKEQAEIVARLESLGARHVDVGQRDVPFVVLADPEGNEFCVLEPRDTYRDTGVLAAIVLHTPQPAALAPFWSAASGWPVVEANDVYASLRSEDGGPYLEFLRTTDPKTVKNRVHLDVAPYLDGSHAEEVARLEAMGAVRVDVGQRNARWVVLADPQGNEFCVLTPR
jgi:predicted enzyme related to lactoylglutathione lyase